MRKSIALMFVAAFAAVSLTAFEAQAGTPRVDRRQAHQSQRIREGVRSGQLTRGETRHLLRGQAHVRRMERRAKADGVVTPGERARLRQAQRVQSRHIARARHNGLNRF